MGSQSFVCKINGRLIEFFHIPKCGGTSVKTMLLEAMDYDWKNSPAADWGLQAEERKYTKQQAKFRSEFFLKQYGRRPDYRFTVIRDPVDRMVSVYTNRVLFYRKMADPGWDRFINKMPNWSNSDITHHAMPMWKIIGTNPRMYKVFTMDEIKTKVPEFLSEIAGKEVSPMQRQTGVSEKKKNIVVTEQQINKIKRVYDKDYRTWWNKDVVPQAFE